MLLWPKRSPLLGIVLLFVLPLLAGQSDKSNASKDEEHLTKLRVEVTAGEKNQPVVAASIYVRFTRDRLLRKARKVELNLKTNREGFAVLPDVPRGSVTIQVIAEGWKTFGQNYELTQQEQTIKIKLERPPRWY